MHSSWMATRLLAVAMVVAMAGCAVDERGIAWLGSDASQGDARPDGSSGGSGGTGGGGGSGGRGGGGGLDGPGPDRDDPDTSYSLDVPNQPYQDGWPCTGPESCAGGFCVDNVCCESACAGTCMACARMRTARPDGQCRPIPSGQDPEEECSTDGTACGRTGVCSGGGSCAMAAAGLSCGPPSCSGNVVTPPPRCNGSGNCLVQPTQPCAGHLRCADALTCKGTCAGDGDCVPGSECNLGTGACSAPKALGAACDPSDQGRDCASGNCVDGVCCDSNCDDGCEACVASRTGATSGTCAPVTAGIDPDDDCDDEGPRNCGHDGTCDGAGDCRDYADGTVCETKCCATGDGLCESTCRLGDCDDDSPNRTQCNGPGACCCQQPLGGGGPACVIGLQCLGGCSNSGPGSN
jgi:hypothetical protein